MALLECVTFLLRTDAPMLAGRVARGAPSALWGTTSRGFATVSDSVQPEMPSSADAYACNWT
jgi:hypothetical protein